MRLRIQFLLHRRLHVRQQTTVSTVIGKVSYTHPKRMTKKRHGKCEMLSSDEGDEVTATHRPQLTLPSRNPGMVKRHTHEIVPINLEQGIQNKNRYLRAAISFAFIAVIIRIVTNKSTTRSRSKISWPTIWQETFDAHHHTETQFIIFPCFVGGKIIKKNNKAMYQKKM